nr:immunoglobulin heavy chain junction region [Macaca mulatta]MOV38141.1 immunoglobulin heavy chain junction region [Macaca mulatta]MOV38240.1 immunoglobulin heavy chain junction region [Macaca mulatta]MOV38363.1 immunoglobulin heavy chain junction region [Macaca mulatta]MOV38444.1 immunoglobulin heavy chain junction region [Macaca mulatta]
CGVGLDSW